MKKDLTEIVYEVCLKTGESFFVWAYCFDSAIFRAMSLMARNGTMTFPYGQNIKSITEIHTNSKTYIENIKVEISHDDFLKH